MALDAETDPDLKRASMIGRELKVDQAILSCWKCITTYTTGTLPASEFVASVRLIRGLRFPPGDLRHPAELPDRIFANFNQGAQKGPLP